MNYLLSEKKGYRILIGISFMSAIIYTIVEWIFTSEIKDSIFIGILISATIFLIISMNKLYSEITTNTDLYFFVYDGRNLKDINKIKSADKDKIFNGKRTTISGIVFSLIFGIFIFNMGTWPNNNYIQISFIVYLVIVNFIAGLSLYSLMQFLIISYRWGCDITFKVSTFDNKATRAVRVLRNRVLLIMSIYISMSLSSVLFSSIIINNMVKIYSLFAFILIMIAYLIPEISISKNINNEKDSIIDDLNIKISEEYVKAFNHENTKQDDLNLKKLNALFDMKIKIMDDNASYINPSKILYVVGMLSISSVPVIIEWVLSKVPV